MNTIIETMISAYKTETIYDKKNAMKEVLQEIILCGLSRAVIDKCRTREQTSGIRHQDEVQHIDIQELEGTRP